MRTEVDVSDPHDSTKKRLYAGTPLIEVLKAVGLPLGTGMRGKTLINVTLNRQNGPMTRGNTVSFTEASPLRLISVAKDAQGYTVVEAEF